VECAVNSIHRQSRAGGNRAPKGDALWTAIIPTSPSDRPRSTVFLLFFPNLSLAGRTESPLRDRTFSHSTIMTSEGSAALRRSGPGGHVRQKEATPGSHPLTKSLNQICRFSSFLRQMGIFRCYLARSKSSSRDHCTGADAYRCLKVATESIPGEAARCPVFFENCQQTITRPAPKMISRPRRPSLGR
jgi:hypothetical protein